MHYLNRNLGRDLGSPRKPHLNGRELQRSVRGGPAPVDFTCRYTLYFACVHTVDCGRSPSYTTVILPHA